MGWREEREDAVSLYRRVRSPNFSVGVVGGLG